MKPIFDRGPSLHVRFFLALLVSGMLILLDGYWQSFAKIRYTLENTVSPFYYVANIPRVLLDEFSENLTSRHYLMQENKQLRTQLQLKNSELLLFQQLTQENNRLRQLLGSPLRHDERKMAAQVLSNGSAAFNDQVVIDKGSADGVYLGQAVINERGVVGQVVALSNSTSRILLICNASHAIPIQVLRNDIRVIASGNGCNEELQLEYLPNNADIQVGDILVTSGLGGRFPEGYPVAVVSSLQQDRQTGYRVIRAQPTAELRRLRYLLLLWQPPTTTPPSLEHVQSLAKERLLQMLPTTPRVTPQSDKKTPMSFQDVP